MKVFDVGLALRGQQKLGNFVLESEKYRFRPWACPPGAKNLGDVVLESEKYRFRPWTCPPVAKNQKVRVLHSEKRKFPITTEKKNKKVRLSHRNSSFLIQGPRCTSGVPFKGKYKEKNPAKSGLT